MRFDASSLGVMGLATACAVVTAMGLGQMARPAEAAPRPVLVASAAPADEVAAATVSGREARLPRDAAGHYWAQAVVTAPKGERAVRLMVDTGASVVVLTRDDARRLGFDLTAADFQSKVITASGEARAASVELDAVSVAGARVEKVQALVVERGLPHSLLGMSYLGRLSGFTATPTGLTLSV